MFSAKSIAAAAAAISLVSSVSASSFSASSKNNVAVYWGQGTPGYEQQRLADYCDTTDMDIIMLAFVNVFPAQGNGYPGTNFANMCWGGSYVYAGPGDDSDANSLQTECPTMNEDIPYCQSLGKKVLLSLGGDAASAYDLEGTQNGIDFAEFLWGAFGPQTEAWVAAGKPRPFDNAGVATVVDGFDFDIEKAASDSEAGYIAMITRLRELFLLDVSKTYYISGAPQCVVPDANMQYMIAATQFDFLFVQYYNTPQCSARSFIDSNPSYTPGSVEVSSGFSASYDSWVSFIRGTASADAKIYIGLPGSDSGNGYFLETDEMKSLLEAYYDKEKFGGVMIWEATGAYNTVDEAGNKYYGSVKSVLGGCGGGSQTSTSSIVSSTSTPSLPSSTSCSTTPGVTSSSVSVSSSSILSSSSSSNTISSVSSVSVVIPTNSANSSSSVSTVSGLIPTNSANSSSISTSSSIFIPSGTAPFQSHNATSSVPYPTGTGHPHGSAPPSGGPRPTGPSSAPIGKPTQPSGIYFNTTTCTETHTPPPNGPSSAPTGPPTQPSGSLPPSGGSSSGPSGQPSQSSGTLPVNPTGPSSTPQGQPTGPTGSPSGPSGSASETVSSITSSVPMTTKTIYTTTEYTVTSCASSVTNCPARGSVTTETIAVSTTVCPVTETETSPVGTAPVSSKPALTTSTVYTTSAHTVTSGTITTVVTETIPLYTTVCPVTETETSPVNTPSVTKPASTTSTVYTTTEHTITSSGVATVVTDTIALYTTVCPVTETETTVPTTSAVVETYTTETSAVEATTTVQSTSTSTTVVTVKVQPTTLTVIPVPVVSSSLTPVAVSSAVSSVVVPPYPTGKSSSAAGEASSTGALVGTGSSQALPTPSAYTSGAESISVRSKVGVLALAGAVAAFIM